MCIYPCVYVCCTVHVCIIVWFCVRFMILPTMVDARRLCFELIELITDIICMLVICCRHHTCVYQCVWCLNGNKLYKCGCSCELD